MTLTAVASVVPRFPLTASFFSEKDQEGRNGAGERRRTLKKAHSRNWEQGFSTSQEPINLLLSLPPHHQPQGPQAEEEVGGGFGDAVGVN